MKKIHILVEGQTEENFVNKVLSPYFNPKNIYLFPIIITTKKVLRGPNHKGGITSFQQVKNDLIPLLSDSSANIVTTMIDYYALPNNFPGYSQKPKGSPYKRVEFLEEEFSKDISNKKFIPYLQLHEFEALIFANYGNLVNAFPGKKDELEKIELINKQFQSPEEINENPNTAPSKRLEKIYGNYQKIFHSQLVLIDSNITDLRRKCSHFDNWLTKLES
ncbi:MAG: DUF4276 family protein [Ignavibacteriae bacterium]|nr:DUF4276 family protein [Ignavibacteriota bacterium]